MSFIHLGICVDCNTYIRPKKNDVHVLEMMDEDRPYKVWNADLMYCPSCERETLGGFGKECVSEHFQQGFERWVELCDYKVGPIK